MDPRFQTTYNLSTDGFWGSKIVKRLVGRLQIGEKKRCPLFLAKKNSSSELSLFNWFKLSQLKLEKNKETKFARIAFTCSVHVAEAISGEARYALIWCLDWSYPTDPFTGLGLQNPSHDVQHKILKLSVGKSQLFFFYLPKAPCFFSTPHILSSCLFLILPLWRRLKPYNCELFAEPLF